MLEKGITPPGIRVRPLPLLLLLLLPHMAGWLCLCLMLVLLLLWQSVADPPLGTRVLLADRHQ